LHERTAEERERDRLERDRRRAQREGPEPPFEAPAPLEPEPPPWDVDPAAVELDSPAAQQQPPPPLEPSPPPQREGPSHRGITRARVAALLALAAAIALVWFVISLFQPFAGSGHGRVIVQIPKGSSSSEIGSILARDGVVSSGFFFDVRALLEGKRSSLHSGRFVLKHDMSYSAAIDALSKPPPKVIAVKVVIPEGYTRRQISELVREDALSGDYLVASKRSRLLSPGRYGAPAGTRDLEGFLFPATYDLRAGAPVQKLVSEQLTAFSRRFGASDVRRAHALGVTPYELLTVASMIEREAQTEHDRPLIAAVIYNRLREGIPLGIDATIYYAVEQQKGIATYTGELTSSMLRIDSPYNTRTHKGLPPTPISNPGEASIHAAAHPAHVPYLYYVAGADGCGEQVFSKTYSRFEKDVAAYDAAVKKNGGKPPTCKKK
jgi:peptidoglycan lytic transglycosylase G